MHKKENAFLCDVDGTIASHFNADGSLRRGHFEYEKVSDDLPIWPVIRVVKILAAELQPIFVTGREEHSRLNTSRWITNHINPYGTIPYMRGGFPLFMREDGNYEKDFSLKGRIYDKYIDPRWNIQFAIDDRLQVCQMWHSIGVPVFRVGDPDATF